MPATPPASIIRLPSADLPSPSVTPTIGTPGAPIVVDGSCGHGAACPDGSGSFRSTFAPASQRGSRHLLVRYDVPAGWSLVDMIDGGLVVREDPVTSVGVYWPLAPIEGAGDARAAASAMATLPGALSSTPEKVSISGRTAWRVTFVGDAGAGQTVIGSTCVVPNASPHEGDAGCLQVARTVDRATGAPVGVAGPNPVEVTFVDVPDSDAAGNSAILGIWRSAVDLPSDSAGRSIVDSIQVETTER